MQQSKYTEKVIEHFKNPHNQGSIANPDGVGQVGNPVCGDIMKLYIKIEKGKEGKEIISDIKFETLGCAAAIATSSMITDMAKGKTLDEAIKLTRANVASELGGLPPIKMHCSNLAVDALHAAIKDYRKRNKL
jgi:nitrogen fixation NifU-like protein